MTHPLPIIAENVSCRFGDQLIVDDANLMLEPGRVTALLGASGAGKSTLLRLFSGLEIPSQGRILHGDTLLSDGAVFVPAERRRIGMVFQDFALFPNLTASQNIAFGLAHLPKPERAKLAAHWLEQISLSHRADAYPHQMSGGEQQRIAIARALAPEPVALLMDEPFSGLDPALRDEVRQTAFKAIAALGIPSLLVTHDAGEAMQFADNLAVMRAGRIVQQGTPEQIYTRPIDAETAAALGPIITLAGTWNTQTSQIETALGAFAHAKPETSGAISVSIRPEAFIPDPASSTQTRILSARRNGPLMQLDIEREGTIATISVSADEHIVSSEQINLRLNPDLCFVF